MWSHPCANALMQDENDYHDTSNEAPLSDAEYEQLAFDCEDMDLGAVWHEFGSPFRGDDWPARFRSFEGRKRAFLWVVRRLVQEGRVVLVPVGQPDVRLPGSLDEQIEVMSRAFPTCDDGMDNGIWFLMPECPFGGNWRYRGTGR